MATETTTTTTQTQPTKGSGDVETTLTYFSRVAPAPEPADFTKPGTEEKWDAVQRMTESVPTTIHNIRGKEAQYTLAKNGFQYTHDPIPALSSCATEDEIRDLLLPATEDLVKRVTGAYKTVVFTHRIRNVSEDASKRADNRAPAHAVHTDFTLAGAQNQLRTVIRDADFLAALEKDNTIRIMTINVWRPLAPIKRDPLAILNWASVNPAKDIVPQRMIMNANFWAELGKVRAGEGHEWVYMEGQTESEPVVFVQWDSSAERGMTTPHSAFVDERWVGEGARRSIEIKMFAFVKA